MVSGELPTDELPTDELPTDELPVDRLPNGLPLFNLYLHLPALDARLQLFRFLRTYVVEGFTLHTLLVHPEDLEAVGPLASALGFFQLHGQVWLLGEGSMAGRPALTLARAGRAAEYALVRPAAPPGRLFLMAASGRVVADDECGEVLADDLAKVRLLRECFLAEYADDALSVPFVRPYPGLTSLIRRRRRFARFFRTDPVGPGTWARDPWPALAGAGAQG